MSRQKRDVIIPARTPRARIGLAVDCFGPCFRWLVVGLAWSATSHAPRVCTGSSPPLETSAATQMVLPQRLAQADQPICPAAKGNSLW